MIICRMNFGIFKQPVGKLFALTLTFSLENGQSVTACGVCSIWKNCDQFANPTINFEQAEYLLRYARVAGLLS